MYVKVLETNDVPAVICGSCVYELWNADKLRKRCIDANEYFRTKIQKTFLKTKSFNSPTKLDNAIVKDDSVEVKMEEDPDWYEIECLDEAIIEEPNAESSNQINFSLENFDYPENAKYQPSNNIVVEKQNRPDLKKKNRRKL